MTKRFTTILHCLCSSPRDNLEMIRNPTSSVLYTIRIYLDIRYEDSELEIVKMEVEDEPPVLPVEEYEESEIKDELELSADGLTSGAEEEPEICYFEIDETSDEVKLEIVNEYIIIIIILIL